MCKAITKAGVDINADDIEDCHRVGNKGQIIIKFARRKVSSQCFVSESTLKLK